MSKIAVGFQVVNHAHTKNPSLDFLHLRTGTQRVMESSVPQLNKDLYLQTVGDAAELTGQLKST